MTNFRGQRLRVVAAAFVLAGSVASGAAANPEAAPPPTPAVAVDPSESDHINLARATFQEGLDLAHRARWAEALAAFERSARLRPHAVTTYNIGFCELSLGAYTPAWRALVTALLERDPSGAPSLPDTLRGSAEAYAAEAEQALVRVVLTTDPPGAAVAVDSRPLEPLTLGGRVVSLAGTREPGPAEPVPSEVVVVIDPGVHVFTIAAAGRSEQTLSRTFAPGQHATLLLHAPPMLALAAPAPPRARAPSRTAAYVALGVGGAGLVSAAIFGGLAMAKAKALPGQCPAKGCPSGAATDHLDTATTAATIATISLGVGAAAVATGAVLWVLGTPSRRTGVEPVLGARYVGVSARF